MERLVNTNDHDLLIELNVNIKEILRRIDAQEERFSKMDSRITLEVSDLHSRIETESRRAFTRIERLENFRWYLLGIIAIITVILTSLGSFGELFKKLIN